MREMAPQRLLANAHKKHRTGKTGPVWEANVAVFITGAVAAAVAFIAATAAGRRQ